MDRKELKQLAKKYLDGTASAEEKQLLSQWYDTIHLGGEEEVFSTDETEQQLKQRILNNIKMNLAGDNSVPVTRSDYNIKKLVIQVASIAAMLAIVAYAMWPSLSKKVIIKEGERQVITVPQNRVMHITLPDGSKVWLNKGTIFRYPKSFAGTTRVVDLIEGRAFFDIKHDKEHPFVVKTKTLNITVLGTSFDVSTYKKEGSTRVSVVTGKVGITMPQRSKQVVMLLPKQQVVLSNLTNQLVKQTVHEAILNDWCKDNFVFEQETLQNVFKALEKEYNATIIVENKKLLDERITIKLGSHLDSTMETISFTKHFKYQIVNDSTVVVK